MLKFGINKNPTDILLDLPVKHKTLRKQMGLTQAELAKRSGVSLGSIKRFELTGQIAHILNRLNDFELIFKPLDNLEKIEKLFSDKTR
jgi:transcriptional regulator with XRE-family HTH domain